MRKKIKRKPFLIIGSVAVLCIAAVVVEKVGVLLNTVGYSAKLQAYLDAQRSESTGSWEEVESGEVTLYNQRVRFVLDSETGHFHVTDINTGAVYFSVPSSQEELPNATGDASSVQSELRLIYFNQNGEELELNSYKDSVENRQFTVQKSGDAVRVIYRLGKVKTAYLLPAALDKTVFEEIVNQLESGGRKLRLYYDLYSPDNPTDAYREMKKQYSYLEDHAVYFLRKDAITDILAAELAGYMEQAGYTEERYAEDMARMGITEEEEETPTAFSVPVEYTLTDSGFSARVVSSQITSAVESDILHNIVLLEYFGSVGKEEDGFMLVPDGSGAIIRLGESGGQQYVQKLYGEDEAKTVKRQGQLTQTALLPVFGMGYNNSGYLAVIEGADAAAAITAKTYGGVNPQNTVYATFTMTDYDRTTVGESRQMSDIPLFSDQMLCENPQVTYTLLECAGDPLMTMAAAYRTGLTDAGLLQNKEAGEEDIPLYLDFTGILYRESTILGIPYRQKQVLSTLSEILDIVEQLETKGITRLIVRLKGFSTDGALNNGACQWSLDKDAGTEEQLEMLQKKLEDNGGKLYWEAPVSDVYQDAFGDGFWAKSDAVRQLNRKEAFVNGVDRVTLEYSNSKLGRYLVSPANYQKRAACFLKSLGGAGEMGISWGAAGHTLYSDFNQKRTYDRAMSLQAVRETLESLADQRRVLTEGGCAYVWPYTSDIVDMPLTDSGYEISSYACPFTQMVLHGYIPYGGTALNLSANPEKQYLYTIAAGAALHYSWITRADTLLLDTAYESEQYSLYYGNWIEDAVERYAAMNTALKGTSQALITAYTADDRQMYTLTYDNQTTIAVNFSDQNMQANGQTIPARSWSVIPQRQEG